MPYRKEKTCQICDAVFTAIKPMQIYCGAECKKIARREVRQRYYLKQNPSAYSKPTFSACSICGDKFASCFKGVPYCNKHYLRMFLYGSTELRGRKNTNQFIDASTHYEVHTASGEIIIIDRCDFDTVKNHSWCISKTGYAVANIQKKVKKMHRVILDNNDPRIVIDHINGNKLDNRRQNLRHCRTQQNSRNSKIKKTNKTGYPGVRLLKSGLYKARITINCKEIHLWHFQSIEAAIEARKQAEVKYYGLYSPSLGVLRNMDYK